MEMEGEVYEAIGVTEVHLHPVGLGAQVDGDAVRQHLHPWIDRFYRACVTCIVEGLLEQIRKALC